MPIHSSNNSNLHTKNEFNIFKLIRNYFVTLIFAEFILLPFLGFTFEKFIVILLGVAVLFTVIIVLGAINKNVTGSGVKAQDEYSEEIQLFEPRINPYSEEKLVVLKRNNINWKLEDADEFKEVKEEKKSSTKNTVTADKDKKDTDLKKRYNPYRSPFEPINNLNVNRNEVLNQIREVVEPKLIQQDVAKNPSSSEIQAPEDVAVVIESNSSTIIQEEQYIEPITQVNLDASVSTIAEEIIVDEVETRSKLTLVDTEIRSLSGKSYTILDEEEDITKDEDIPPLSVVINKIVEFKPRINTFFEEEDTEYNSEEYEEHQEELELHELQFEDDVFMDYDDEKETKEVEEILSKIDISHESNHIPYFLPPVELLKAPKNEYDLFKNQAELEYTANKLVETLASFGVGAKVIEVSSGPSVTRYELQPNAGVKVSKIVGLADDIALNLAATGVRIEAPIPGKAAVGIEVPNKEVTAVLLREVIDSPEFQNHPSKLAFALGRDVSGRTIVGDIAKMPHMLIAGATGSGKSVCINTLIASILYKASPEEVKLLMVDPKVVELGIYNGIPHLLIPVVTDPKKAAGALNWAVVEMTTRYKLFADNNVRDLKGYNAHMKQKGESTLPNIVIIIDELADLMMVAPNDVEDCICRLAQMARAAGMHLVIATQRPSVDVITGVIKANIPSRISFAVSSQIDSRTILDMSGAEKLLGRGDMLYNPLGEMKPIRVQGSFISDKEVEALVEHLKTIQKADYDQNVLDKINSNNDQSEQKDMNDDDDLLPQVIEMCIDYGQASASLIQRKFKVGYSRAARILDQMESWGVVGPADGSKPRQILMSKDEWYQINS